MPIVIAEDSRAANARTRRWFCLAYALAATLAVLCWQAATVHFNYGGNWTALFETGDRFAPPPELAAQTYVFKNSTGYDGEFYRYVAHAPWVRIDWARYFDSLRLRYQRILLPASAWLLAAGRGGLVDGVYISLILGWIFVGVYWLGRYAVEEGHGPAWGLAFLLLPATLTSIDRMTVDVALAALCVLFVRYEKKPGARLYLTLLLASLARETGALLVAAQVGYDLCGKRWRRAALFATALLPAAAWDVYVWRRVASVAAARPAEDLYAFAVWLFKYPAIGIAMKLFLPEHYPFSPIVNRIVQGADALALCGLLALLATGAWCLRRLPWDAEQWTIAAFIALAVATSRPSFWEQVYSYGRVFSPLVFFATLQPLRRGAWWALVPVSLMALRIGIQMAPQAFGILRAIL
ncbi:MAG: hypothetical protein ACLPWF_02510 [Bryobacteraceae bacterium]